MMREPAFTLLPRPPRMALGGKRVLVLGLGDTGLSVARWIERNGGTPRVADTRQSPPRKNDFKGDLHTGPFGDDLLVGVDLVCISPGLPLEEPLIVEARQRHIPVVGDVELFAWHNTAKVLAITGTNGKSTVTALTGHLLRGAGIDCEVAGNIGPAVLEAALRRRAAPAAWVLELSSYQLETTWSLAPHAAAVLNVTEDHLDRYAGLGEYAAAKARIFQGAGVQVLNRDDPRVLAMALPGTSAVTFGLEPHADWCVRNGDLARGNVRILEIAALPIHGRHNVANALAACALAATLGVRLDALAAGLKTFKGLPHRLERVRTRRGVEWYDDSKGTNVGATIAALKGLAKPTVLILGGEGKGQDFSPLAAPVRQFARAVLLIGRDAPIIEQAVPGERCGSLEEAVQRAARLAQPGDAVLLSPACASFDMFRDYKHRGEVFAAAVRGLPA
jgi:UDP-N-acetylmuramoylalanine--D-glutamate ligase